MLDVIVATPALQLAPLMPVVPIVSAPSVLAGWVVNASCVACPGLTVTELEAAVPPRPKPTALKV